MTAVTRRFRGSIRTGPDERNAWAPVPPRTYSSRLTQQPATVLSMAGRLTPSAGAAATERGLQRVQRVQRVQKV
jgi:hypothetical protein